MRRRFRARPQPLSTSRHPLVWLTLLVCACQGAEPLAERQEKVTVPSGFTETVVTTGVSEPTALAFLPSGTILVTSRSGKVRVIKNGTTLLGTAAVDLTSRVCPERERGLLGIAVDPEFASNKQVYVYYTSKHANCSFHDVTGAQNRVSRFTYDTATDRMSNEVILVDGILSWHGWHNAGHLQFGADGYLYFGVGDSGANYGGSNTGWSNDNSRYKSLLNGKVLRVKKENGEPAPGNPWLNAPGSRRCGNPNQTPSYPLDNNRPCQETFAWGLRNPFRIPFKPGTNTFFINEVGQDIGSDWEEINEGRAGADYGWNRNQGHTSDASTTNPIYTYAIGDEVGGSACRCITGGAFTPEGAFPSAYEGSYFFGDYTCGALFKLQKDANGTWKRSTFATGFGGSSLVELAFGPNPSGGTSLYYTSFNGNKVARIDGPASTNRAPTAVVTAAPRWGATPLSVSFDGSGSFDPDSGDSITRYLWSFGDGSPVKTTTTPTTTHVYSAAGTLTATLTVEDSRTPRKQGSTTIDIQPGNTPPTVSIVSPPASKLYAVGEHIAVQASASDAQDGTLPATAISWDIKKVHDDHTHPFQSGQGYSIDLVPDGPEPDPGAAELSHLRLSVTATDSRGLTSTATLELQPHRVPLTFRTQPAGLKVHVEASDLTDGASITAWEGWDVHVNAPAQVLNGHTYVLDSWSDGQPAEHIVHSPASATTYTARFREAAFSAHINFQLGSAIVPAGYLEDDGSAYHAQNGLRYGWSADNTAAARERENPASPDKRYDTTILMQKSGNKSWEIEVPNGTYQVHLVAGDASYFDSVYDLTAEGATIVSGTPTTGTRWLEATRSVTVSDGRLTIANGPNGVNNRICFIDITAGSAPPPTFHAKVDFAPSAAPAYGNGYLLDDGAVFGARAGGVSYGWSGDNSAATRDRDSALSPDQRYDTCILPQKTGNKSWEIAVPNGSYRVRLVAGDAGFFDSVFDFTLEGAAALSGTPTSAARWIESTTTVSVSDGRLTLDNGPSARNNKLAFVEIDQQ
jgi:glucose/arabinose dehydrogenase